MTDLTLYENVQVNLHSETIDVIRRTLPNGVFDLAATNGRLRVWSERFPEIEPEFLNWIKLLQEDDCLWDIGASIGHFACYTAITQRAQIVAFEPEHQNFATLSLNHYLNQASIGEKLIPLNFSVGPEQKLWEMSIRLYGAGEHTKSVTPDSQAYSINAVQLTLESILDLGIPAPTYIKIDVDGAEDIVLEGLEPLLGALKGLFIELPLSKIDETEQFLQTYGLTKVAAFEVIRMSGGTYPDIRNVTFERLA